MASNGRPTRVLVGGKWQTEKTAEMGVASIPDISGNARTLVPAILIHSQIGDMVATARRYPAATVSDRVDGQDTHRISCSDMLRTTYWVSRKTFFLVKSMWQTKDYAFAVEYDAPRINGPVSAKSFAP